MSKRERDQKYYQENRDAIREKQRLYYLANPEARKEKANKYGQSFSGKMRGLLKSALARAEQKQLDFDLTLDWVESQLSSGVCAVTKIPFEYTAYHPFSPQIDRAEPKKGYVQSNCQVVCRMYNGAKGCGTHNDVLKFVEALCQQPNG